MKYRQILLLFVVTWTLSACAVFQPVQLPVGTSEAEVIAKLGRPTSRIPDGEQHLLEYSHNPWGQAIDMARFDKHNRLLSYEQVLTLEKFATIKLGQSTKTEVLRTIGHPSESMYLSRLQLEVWTYPYKEHGIWDSEMNVHFDNNGVVKMMLNGPDPRFQARY